jgi:epoxyqueuosine reductase
MDAVKGLVKKYALEVGFDLVGVASAEAFAEHKAVTLQRIRQGLMDGLPWFTEARVARGADPQSLLPGARSIISLGLSYHLPEPVKSSGMSGRVARYAWGDDYHQVMKSKMKDYVQGLSQRLSRELQAKWYMDDGPMLDRVVASRAGIGWFGKNTNILSSSHGSWIFLGQVVTDLELEPDAPSKKTCGQCVRCIVACPTGAIVAPYVLDNKRCISHLTIENRGPIPLEFRPLMADWVFGCDICQDVCPVNVKAQYSKEKAFQKKRFTTLELTRLLEMTETEFQQKFANSPIKRAKLWGLKRNACVALGNSGDKAAAPALVKVLRDEHPIVRGHAAWALGRLGGEEARAALEGALGTEGDEEARKEISLALLTLQENVSRVS